MSRRIIGKIALHALLLAGLILSAHPPRLMAAEPLPELPTPEQQQTYERLIRELRCLVCKNQNLMDSNADLAADLRRKTHEMVTDGKSYGEVVEYMTDRFGNFVMYRPPLKASTLALWSLPFIALAMLLAIILYRVRKRYAARPAQLEEAERRTAEDMLRERDSSS